MAVRIDVRSGGVARRLTAARQRVRDGAWSVAQCSVAAGLAWALAQSLLGHPNPFLACVAAVVCLGVRAAQRLRRVAELAVGVTVGVAVGDLLVGQIGRGAWQISFVIAVALLLALALDGGPLLVAQTGLQAVFVLALPRMPGGDLARWEDALLGGACALLVAALLPADPWRPVGVSAARTLTDVATALREAAQALRARDAGRAAEALSHVRATQPGLDAWSEAIGTGRDISRLSPLRRDRGATHARQERLWTGADRAVRNLRVLVRRVLSAVETDEAVPAELADLVDRLATAVALLAEDPQVQRTDAAQALVGLAADLDPHRLEPTGMSAVVLLAQLRTAVVDLLEGLGVSHDDARNVLPHL